MEKYRNSHTSIQLIAIISTTPKLRELFFSVICVMDTELYLLNKS